MNGVEGDTHDTPASEQLILCKYKIREPRYQQKCLFIRIFIAHVQPVNVLLAWSFFTQDSFSLKRTQPPRCPWYFLLFNFCYAFKDHPNTHI